MLTERIIGRYTGEKRGPLLICFGGMHGNENAGIQALDLIFKMLEVEPITNPEFCFKGRILGLRGNLAALRKKQRFIKKDLNRQWTPEHVKRVQRLPIRELDSEDRELRELTKLIEKEVADYDPDLFVVLDLHTTTAHGGIFSIATDDPESLRIAVELHAPVIKGMLRGLQGTTLHYFNRENFNRKTVPICFESGQHDETLSTNRAVAALINCLRSIGCVRPQDVENRHDSLLIEFSENLPKVADLLGVHTVKPKDRFRMMPGYQNFQEVKKGELLAYDRHGAIYSPENALVLMPRYQNKGDDGFFLIKKIDGY